MDITPYIWGVTGIAGAILFGLSIGWTRHLVIDLFPTKHRSLRLIYLKSDGQQFNAQLQIGGVRWRKDELGNKHLLFEALDNQGTQHVLAAERVLAAYAENGDMFANFQDYLLHLRRKDALQEVLRFGRPRQIACKRSS